MFTGIVEAAGKVLSIEDHGLNKTFWIESSISPQLRVDESLSHNGICLTIERIEERQHQVTAIKETIDKTNIKYWKALDFVNLERSMLLNGRLDGHIVQGHVDDTAECIQKRELEGSVEFTFAFNKRFASLVIEKGSVCLNGVSLTAFNVGKKKFTVAIIPYTFKNTNFSFLEKGSTVNIEFDLIGKYVNRIATLEKAI